MVSPAWSVRTASSDRASLLTPQLCFADLRALHLNLAGHYKFMHARLANITSHFANLSRLSLIDVPILDVAAVFASGDSFPSLQHLIIVRPQFAHPAHPLERARSGTSFGPKLRSLVLGQNWQHVLGSRTLSEFTALDSFTIVGSAGGEAGGFRPLEVMKAPLRRLTLAHAMDEESLLASLKKNLISVSQLGELNILALYSGSSIGAVRTREAVLEWARLRGVAVRVRVETEVAGESDLAELELRVLTGPICENPFPFLSSSSP